MQPWKPPFVMRKNRSAITREPDLEGKWTTQFPDTLGYQNQGGGSVPGDLAWGASPKQWQEELTEEELRQGHHHALPAVAPKP